MWSQARSLFVASKKCLDAYELSPMSLWIPFIYVLQLVLTCERSFPMGNIYLQYYLIRNLLNVAFCLICSDRSKPAAISPPPSCVLPPLQRESASATLEGY